MNKKNRKYRRVNILITEDQHHKIVEKGLSLSGLVRDLLDDRFSDTKITLNLSRNSRKLYDTIISNFGASDKELEQYFVAGLDRFLSEKSKEIDTLRDKLQNQTIPQTEEPQD